MLQGLGKIKGEVTMDKKKNIIIEVKKRWNGVIEGGYIGDTYIWDFQLEDVIKDYEKEGHKVILQDVD